MINTLNFINFLIKLNIKYFTGVPDSLLDGFIKNLQNNKKISHEPTSNEGSAIALGAGYYLATGKIPLVYMQNSGLCNALNPILSLIDKKVYSIPQIILIGQRGAPGIQDEPQHVKIGPKTLHILKTLDLDFIDLSKIKTEKKIFKCLFLAVRRTKQKRQPIFLVINKNFFTKESNKKKQIKKDTKKNIKRIQYIERIIASKNHNNSIFFSTTGFTSRELYHLNSIYKKGHGNSFYNIGAMGHVSQIACAFAKFFKNKDKKSSVVVLDGDGSLQMQMGNILTIGKSKNKILHIVFNNGCHESTGGHFLASKIIDYELLFKSSGYKKVKTIKNLNEFNMEIKKSIKFPTALIINVNPGTIDNLPRPKYTTIELKKFFLKKRNIF